jgi:hypothetical protein
MGMQATLLEQTGARAQARALAFTGEYLQLMAMSTKESQGALDQVTKMNGLAKVDMYEMEAALDGSHILGEEQVTKVGALLGQK